eukprot:1015241-Lingulodinium_polyedra.AAC.1
MYTSSEAFAATALLAASKNTETRAQTVLVAITSALSPAARSSRPPAPAATRQTSPGSSCTANA